MLSCFSLITSLYNLFILFVCTPLSLKCHLLFSDILCQWLKDYINSPDISPPPMHAHRMSCPFFITPLSFPSHFSAYFTFLFTNFSLLAIAFSYLSLTHFFFHFFWPPTLPSFSLPTLISRSFIVSYLSLLTFSLSCCHLLAFFILFNPHPPLCPSISLHAPSFLLHLPLSYTLSSFFFLISLFLFNSQVITYFFLRHCTWAGSTPTLQAQR